MPKRRSIAEQTGGSVTDSSSRRQRPKLTHPAVVVESPRPTPRRNTAACCCVSDVDNQAADIVQKVLDAHATGRRGVSVKALALAPGVRASKAVYAVVCKTLKEASSLKTIAQQLGLIGHISEGTALVLLYEILVGEGLRRKGKAERLVLEHAEAAKALYLATKASQAPELTTEAALPRCVRVNTLKWSAEEAQAYIQANGWRQPMQNPLLQSVLQLASDAQLYDDPSVKDGRLILQSRASCLSAAALQPEPGWHVIDACAAPGNKTSHAAALMCNQGQISAFDKDAQRAASMRASMARMGATCVHVEHADFLGVPAEDPKYAQVKGVLVDPSCSGSGTARAQLDQQLGGVDADRHQARLRRLADFQVKILSHALTFPAVERLVYSTCSVHAEENELVVARVLPLAHELGFHLASALPAWPRRGLPGLCEGAERLLRVDPEQDQTDGFFVALFERLPDQPSAAKAGL